MSVILFFNDCDSQFRTISCSQPGLDLQIRRHSAVTDFVTIAKRIEPKQFGCDSDAAGMSLAALAVDVYSQWPRSRDPVRF